MLKYYFFEFTFLVGSNVEIYLIPMQIYSLWNHGLYYYISHLLNRTISPGVTISIHMCELDIFHVSLNHTRIRRL